MNKVCLITGANSSLGLEIAKKFAKNKYDLILCYHKNNEDLNKLVNELEKLYDINIKKFYLDLTSEVAIVDIVKNIKRLDVLINNAAYCNDTNWDEKKVEEFQKILNINLIGPYLMIKYLYKLLKISNGNIINIASTNGIDTMYPESLDYDASKAGLINMTKNLAQVLSPNIRINAVAPGWISTKNTEDMNPSFKEKELNKILLKRFSKPEEVANLIYFIASEEASFINGSIIKIDGGTL